MNFNDEEVRDELKHLLFFMIDKGYIRLIGDCKYSFDDIIDMFDDLDGSI